jgi:hypothetical protein
MCFDKCADAPYSSCLTKALVQQKVYYCNLNSWPQYQKLCIGFCVTVWVKFPTAMEIAQFKIKLLLPQVLIKLHSKYKFNEGGNCNLHLSQPRFRQNFSLAKFIKEGIVSYNSLKPATH